MIALKVWTSVKRVFSVWAGYIRIECLINARGIGCVRSANYSRHWLYVS